ncbi:hypothetical protein [Polymorphospora sp. NPDC050346]|uniref:hypothetical protein n=1 Tax=Polymorphospora sp. NPDC050346 TaxID=3155780 RepID=UPI00340C1DC6
MRDDELLGLIRDTPWIAELLADFDFDTGRVENGPPEPVRLPNGAPLEMVAGDASGGAFLLAGTGDRRPVVYAGSEGQGGLVAAGLRDALALVVGLPSIHDALGVPVGEDGGRKLRAWLAEADDEIREDLPDLDADRARLRAALDLPEADGLLEALHAAAADEAYRPVSDRGDRYESML